MPFPCLQHKPNSKLCRVTSVRKRLTRGLPLSLVTRAAPTTITTCIQVG